MLDEFLHGSGDMHSLCAKMVFHEELKDVEIKDIKKLRPDLRSKVKSIELDCEDSLHRNMYVKWQITVNTRTPWWY